MTWSLRRRLLVLMAALLLAGLAVADVATYRTLHSYLIGREDLQLDSLAHGAARQLIGGPGDVADYGVRLRGGNGGIQPFVEAFDPSGAPSAFSPASVGGSDIPNPRLPSRLPGVPEDPNAGPSGAAVYLTAPSSRSGQAPFRVRVSSLADGPLVVPGETLVVATPLTDVIATLHTLVWTELGVSAGALLLALLAGAWLVRLSLRPLERMADTAGEIAAGQLDRRVPVDGSRTEAGRLGSALNAMLGRIEGAFAEKEASEARLRRFVADASHELRTPLTSIRGYAELFRRGADRRPEDLTKVMRRIEDEATRMGVLVDDLLLLARLDQGRALESAPVDMAEIVNDALDAARAVEPGRPIEVLLQGPTMVSGDGNRLRQVVDNLLVNVRMHTPPEAPARVRLAPVEDGLWLEVEDRGPGIDPESIPLLFERFYRSDPARAHTGGGAGLGLSIVDAIVRSHGGRVEAANNHDGGACFRVLLPLTAPSGPA